MAHVLLVEDEADARWLLSRALERAGHRCSSAANAREALLVHDFVDVVVSDVVLGDDQDGGLDLLLALRAAGVSAPVVLITAFASVEKLKLALNRGAAYLLEKPFRSDALLEIVETLLRQVPDVTHHVDQTLRAAGLTSKELTVARHLLKGLSSVEIGALENNSDKTIRQHISRIYQKLGVTSRSEFFHFLVPL